MGKRQYKQPHTPFPKRHTALFVCIFGPCGESGHSALGGNSKLVTRSFLSQTNTTRRKSCWRQIVPSESKANMYRPYFWVLCQNIEIYCSQGVGKKNQQSYQLFWNSNNNNNKKKVVKIHYYPMLPVESGLKTSMSKYSSSHRQKRKV